MKRKIYICLILIISIFAMSTIQVFAHPQMLNVLYDTCVGSYDEDGINEMWYALNNNGNCKHISHEETTIKYCFSNLSLSS